MISMKLPNIIAVHSPKYGGKDTFFKIFNELYPDLNYENVKFADKPNEILSIITGMSLDWITDKDNYNKIMPNLKDNNGEPFTLRRLKKVLFTDGFRDNVSKNIWSNALINENDFDKNNSKWIITDLRFLSEVEKVIKYNGIKIKVIPKYEGYVNDGDTHISENELKNYKDWDYIIINDTIENYTSQIKSIIGNYDI